MSNWVIKACFLMNSWGHWQSFSTTKLSLTGNFPIFMELLYGWVSGEEEKRVIYQSSTIWKDKCLPDHQLVHMPTEKSAIICLFCYSSPILCEDACFRMKLFFQIKLASGWFIIFETKVPKYGTHNIKTN